MVRARALARPSAFFKPFINILSYFLHTENWLNEPQHVRLNIALRLELATGEQLIWSAIPDPNRMRVVFWLWLFAVPWLLFALFWEGIAISMMVGGIVQNDPNFSWWMMIFPFFGLPFVAIGLWLVNKPLAVLADARHQIHALTNRRLITLTMRKDKNLKSVEIAKTGLISRKEKADGWGSLVIETGSHRDSDGDQITDRFEFYGIPKVARVDRLLHDAITAHP
jgi:hypothetical protein